MTKEINVQTVFEKDGMFLADDGRLYRYQIIDGEVCAFRKSKKTKVEVLRVFLDPNSREESNFWMIDRYQQQIYRKDKFGKRTQEIESKWDTQAYQNYPEVYGDLLFVISDLTWKSSCPYYEAMEATYRVLRAKGDGYEDITPSICSANERVVNIFGVQGFHNGKWQSQVNVCLKDDKGRKRYVERTYYRQFKIKKSETISWINIRLSEEAKKRLLQGK